MSNPKYTPMQILRDNITLEILNSNNIHESIAYIKVLRMIDGDYLGKPLFEQEIECLEQAYQSGINTSDVIDEEESYCKSNFIINKPRIVLNIGDL